MYLENNEKDDEMMEHQRMSALETKSVLDQMKLKYNKCIKSKRKRNYFNKTT